MKAYIHRRNRTWFTVAVNDELQLVACSFSGRKAEAIARLREKTRPEKLVLVKGEDPIGAIKTISSIFNGEEPSRAPPIDISWAAPYTRRVYAEAMRIPRGKVTTYKELARRTGSERNARAVGNAMASNPLPLLVPCHRVVPSSLTVGNYGMGSNVKRQLLAREGVGLSGDRIHSSSNWKGE